MGAPYIYDISRLKVNKNLILSTDLQKKKNLKYQIS